jgi:hypothetical protein
MVAGLFGQLVRVDERNPVTFVEVRSSPPVAEAANTKTRSRSRRFA